MTQKTFLFVVGFVILAFLLASVMGFYQTEFAKKPILKEKTNPDFLYDFYLSGTPNIENRSAYGTGSITIIGYLDFEAEESSYFFDEIFTQLEKEYINTGSVRFIHKNILSLDDYEQKTSKFQYAKALICVQRSNPDKYYPFYFDLFKISSVKDIDALLDKHNINDSIYKECIAEDSFPTLIEDLSEIEQFGFIGINPRFYIGIEGTNNIIIDGIPAYTDFTDALRQMQITLGE